MVAWIPGRLHQLVDDVAGRFLVGIAHPEVDDVLALGARLRLQVVDDREDVGREPLDSIELVHDFFSRDFDHTVPLARVSTKSP